SKYIVFSFSARKRRSYNFLFSSYASTSLSKGLKVGITFIAFNVDESLLLNVLLEIIFIILSSEYSLMAFAGTSNALAISFNLVSSNSSVFSITDIFCWLIPRISARVSCFIPFISRMRLMLRPKCFLLVVSIRPPFFDKFKYTHFSDNKKLCCSQHGYIIPTDAQIFIHYSRQIIKLCNLLNATHSKSVKI